MIGYTLEIAGDLNTPPEILRNILVRGLDDEISRVAAKNPNAPKDVVETWEKVINVEEYDTYLAGRKYV